jgi:hypothetical protein
MLCGDELILPRHCVIISTVAPIKIVVQVSRHARPAENGFCLPLVIDGGGKGSPPWMYPCRMVVCLAMAGWLVGLCPSLSLSLSLSLCLPLCLLSMRALHLLLEMIWLTENKRRATLSITLAVRVSAQVLENPNDTSHACLELVGGRAASVFGDYRQF